MGSVVNQIIVQESPTITAAMAEDRLPDATKNYNSADASRFFTVENLLGS